MKEGVGVWVFRFGQPENPEVLLVRRATEPYLGHWFTVDGHLEPSETPLEAALRELSEETSLTPKLVLEDLASPCRIGTVRGSVWLHGFVAFVGPDARPVLNEEHTDYAWHRPALAHDLVPLPSQKASLWRAVDRIARRSTEGLLEATGADAVRHPGGTLRAHLERTSELLAEFGARPALCKAGLLHAAYGTDGLPTSLLSLVDRPLLRGLIGEEAERLVYRYGACDRSFTYPALLAGRARYRDRFDRTERRLGADETRDLLELTFANELDVARHDEQHRVRHADVLVPLFRACRSWVSSDAYACFVDTFGLRDA